MNVVEELARDKVVEVMIEDMSIEECWRADLAQEIYLILLEYDAVKLEEMYKKKHIRFFISRIIMNQMFSKNSPFYTKYRKFAMSSEEFKWSDEDDGYQEQY